MRLILHYTKPGDVVLDGFCGTGMAGVAAQMCAAPSGILRSEIEREMGEVAWGARRAILQDLLPSATIAAGLNLPVDADAFDKASSALLTRFDAEWGWMYRTTVLHRGKAISAAIDYTVWSEVMTCPQCASEVIFYNVAYQADSKTVSEKFKCRRCHRTIRVPSRRDPLARWQHQRHEGARRE